MGQRRNSSVVALFPRMPLGCYSLLIGLSFLIVGLTTAPKCAAQKLVDVSTQVTVTKSGLVYNRLTNSFNNLVTVTNIVQRVLNGPLLLVISNLKPTTVTLINQSGQDPSGSFFINLAVPADGLGPGQSISNILLEFSDPSRTMFTFDVSVSTVEILPQPLPEDVSVPLIQSIAPTVAMVGKPIQYQVIAASGNSGSLAFSLSAAPSGMTIGEITGLMQWTPAADQVGDQLITIVAQDSAGQTSQTFTLSVFGLRPIASVVVSAVIGGVITVNDPTSTINGLSINIPAGALGANTRINVSELVSPPTLGGTPRFLMKGFSIDPGGTLLAIPAKITVPYSVSEFDTRQGIPLEDFLGVYFLQTSTGNLQFVDSFSVDKVNHVVAGTIPHFSVFSVTNIAELCPPQTIQRDVKNHCPNTYAPIWPSSQLPVVLVHGFQPAISHAGAMGDESTWGQTRTLLGQVNAGILLHVDAWRFDWDSAFMPFERSAGNLAAALQKLEALQGINLVNIVAHSFGGLLVRTYLEGGTYNNDVNRVMTLGSPHQGIGGGFSTFYANACATLAEFTGEPQTCFEAATGQQTLRAGLVGEGKFLRKLNGMPLPSLQSPLSPQYDFIAGQRSSCLLACSLKIDDGLITTAGAKLCGGSPVDVCSGVSHLEEPNPGLPPGSGLCHIGGFFGGIICPFGVNFPEVEVENTNHPLWSKICSFLGGCSLTGNWAGTATATGAGIDAVFSNGSTETIPVSASFSTGVNSIDATVVFTEPGDVPDVNKGTGTYQMNAPNFSFSITVKDEVVNVSGTISTGPNGLVMSGSGTSSDGDGGSGTITPQTDGFSISGNLTIIQTPGNGRDQEGGSANLTMSPDGNHMTGTATTSDGSQVKWCLDKQGAPKSCQ